MRADELRQNNYVYDVDGDILQIDEISNDYVKFKNTSFRNRLFKIKPIEITEDILLKCGFIKKGNLTYIFEDFKIELKNGLFLFFTFNYCVKLKSLHQLQNLYFALTGEELNVQL